ncbi:MAG TPA: SCO family protein [Candidatus Angelobacter sp.]|nr:SCO family protein [Candidatus Angelobacter sp.]
MQSAKWASMVALSVVLVGGTALFRNSTVSAQGRWGASYFTNLPLVTQDGKTVHFYDDVLKGKIVAINLIYTHCQYSCPLETARLVQVQKMLGDRVGKDIFFYSISIDPKRDTPKVLKAYAEQYHVGPGWTFLTGKKEDIDLISKKLGLYSNPNSSKDGHYAQLLIGNEPMGQWMRNAATDNPRFLANQIGNLLGNWGSLDAASTPAPATANPNNAAAAAGAPFTLDRNNVGQYLYAKQCAACHTIGHGDKIGPDLLGVTSVRDPAWLRRFISAPEKMIAEKDPVATALFHKYKNLRMPNLRVGPDDLEALIKFLASRSQNMTSGGVIRVANPPQSTAK